jgi:hypothetical protein
VLLEFGGLQIGQVAPGRDQATSDILLDPTLASGERDRLQKYFDDMRGRHVYPLGEVHRGHAYLAIALDGEVFLVMDNILSRWSSFDNALRDLLLGHRPSNVR